MSTSVVDPDPGTKNMMVVVGERVDVFRPGTRTPYTPPSSCVVVTFTEGRGSRVSLSFLPLYFNSGTLVRSSRNRRRRDFCTQDGDLFPSSFHHGRPKRRRGPSDFCPRFS